MPRAAGAALVLALLAGATALGAYTLHDDALAVLEELPRAAKEVREAIGADGESGPARSVQDAAQILQGPTQDAAAPAALPAGPGATAGALGSAVQQGIGWVAALAGQAMVVFFLMFFLLHAGGHFRRRLVDVAGSRLERRRITATIIDDMNAQIQRFLLVRAVTAVVVAIATWLALASMGLDHAGVWGILAGLFNSVPYFGPVIVSGGLLVVGFAQGGGALEAIRVSGVALAITSVEGWLLTPLLMGKAERMHVVVVFLGVLLWTWLWGAWGTLLAVPMLAVLKSAADHVEALAPVRRLMDP